jgi:hypothetical protein
LDAEQLEKMMYEKFPYTEIYYALETNGTYVGTSNSADMTVDYRTRPWYVGAVAANGINITAPYTTVTNSTGEHIITYSYPIFDSGNILGVVGVDMNASALTNSVLPKDEYIAGILMVTVEDGNDVFHPFFDYANKENVVKNKYSAVIESATRPWNINIYGNFDSVNKELSEMSEGEVKTEAAEFAEAQQLFQLRGSTAFVESNVARNSTMSARIIGFGPARAQIVVDFVNTDAWAYDDVYMAFESDGVYIGLDPTVDPSIDFRTRPWYVAAKEAGAVVRTPFYTSVSGSRSEIMTFSAPLYDAEGDFVGAVGFDITVDTAKSMLYNGDANLKNLLAKL